MQKQNVTEYKMMRSEMETLKKCITDYMGFLFLLVGGTFSAWGAIAALSKGKMSYPPIGYASLGISVIAVLMLLILVYKFISHNRYAGYCLLLSKEIWEKHQREDELLIWEVCVDQLRASDAEESAHVPPEYKEQFEKVFPAVRKIREEQTNGFTMWFLFKALFQFQKTFSWGFPITILRIFLIVIMFGILFGGYILLWPIALEDCTAGEARSVMAIVVFAVVLALQFGFWVYIARRFQSLMDGHDTVLKFCARFRPIRERILNQNFGITAKWI